MEALILIIAELLLGLLAPVCAVIGAVAVAAFDLLLGLFGAALSVSAVRRWVLYVSGSVAAVGLVAALAVELFLFDPVTRWALARAATATGAELTVARVGGSLIGSRLLLEGAALTRAPGAKAGLDLRAERVAVDLAPLSLLRREVRLRSVEVSGVRGEITAVPRAEPAGEQGRPARQFRAERLAVRDAEIALRRDSGAHLLAVERLDAAPLRSSMAVFDLLFRANLSATVDGAPLSIETVETAADPGAQGRSTRWRLDGVPAAALATAIPKPPFSWLDEGAVTVAVDDDWGIEAEDERALIDRTTIDTDWRVTLSRIRVTPPEEAGMAERVFSTALARTVNGREDDVTFGFGVTLEEGMFRDVFSLDAARLWGAVLDSWADEVARRTGESADAVADKLRATGGRLREMLQRDVPEPAAE